MAVAVAVVVERDEAAAVVGAGTAGTATGGASAGTGAVDEDVAAGRVEREGRRAENSLSAAVLVDDDVKVVNRSYS